MATEFKLVFDQVNDEDANLRIRNKKDEYGRSQIQRLWITGWDREGGSLTVNGKLSTVVHGVDDASGSNIPCTLAIFDWSIIRGTLDGRFRELIIEIKFEAHGNRGDAEPEAARVRKLKFTRADWDPVVAKIAPEGTTRYYRTTKQVQDKHAGELGATGGFEPFVSMSPKYSREHTETVERNDNIQVTGNFAFTGRGGAHDQPNAVRWTMLENASQRSGVPDHLRTAVLLKRRPQDNGQFLGHVSVRYRISPYRDFKETLLHILGLLPHDDPLIFDPKFPNSLSSYDTSHLDQVDLSKEFRLQSIETSNAKDENAPKNANQLSATED